MIDNEDRTDPLKELVPIMGNSPLSPAHGIAAIALTMALKYHDINTVQDGALYMQYKSEGKNFRELQLDHVFETAMKIEAHLIGSERRIAKILVDVLTAGMTESAECRESVEQTESLESPCDQ